MSEFETEKNYDFVQVYREHLDDIPKMAKENYTALRIFMFITKNMDRQNSFTVSVQTFAELLDVSRQTIWRANKYLVDNGYMNILRSGNTNIYIANPDIVWTTYNNNKRYCTFTGTVLVAESEVAKNNLKELETSTISESVMDICALPTPVTQEELLQSYLSDEA